ncbi:hemolysin, partial [Virgibacillus halodenitrificans]|nr:hemolysin [Virgibacillus halodenitrificans]
EPLVEKVTNTEIICNGKIPLHRLNTIFHTDIPEEEDVLAGYLLREFNYFPSEGETLERNNLSFKVLSVDERMLKRVQIIKNNLQQ